jgi:Family of unknown function (DUF6636)
MKYLVALLAVLLANTAQAGTFESFQTPTGNIRCMFDDTDDTPYVRCDMKFNEVQTSQRARDCDLDWGGAFAVDARRAERVCHGDTLTHEEFPVLPYGATWRAAGITCVSQQSGLTCTNRKGRGFQLSRATQRIF